MSKKVRKINRKSVGQPALRTKRGGTRGARAARKMASTPPPPPPTPPTLSPRFSCVSGKVCMVVPDDCSASLILELGEPIDQRCIYVCSMTVDARARSPMSMDIPLEEEGTLRCDIPLGGDITTSVLELHLGKYLGIANEGDTPIIRGPGR